MKIYRIEDSKGSGPYVGKFYEKEWRSVSHEGPNHPTPREECMFDPDCDYHCGFISLNQLHRWFKKEELTNLFNLGYKIVMHKANMNELIIAKKQCLFIKKVG